MKTAIDTINSILARGGADRKKAMSDTKLEALHETRSASIFDMLVILK